MVHGSRGPGWFALGGLVFGLAAQPAHASVVGTRHVGPWTLTLSADRPTAADLAAPRGGGPGSGTGMGGSMGGGDGMGPGGVEPGSGMGGGNGMGPGGMAMLLDNEHPNVRFTLLIQGPAGGAVRTVRLIAVRRANAQPSLTLLRPRSQGSLVFAGNLALPGMGHYAIQTRFLPMGAPQSSRPVTAVFDFTSTFR